MKLTNNGLKFKRKELLSMSEYHKILGVSENATIKEIEKVYKKLALKWHPDSYDRNPQRHPANSKEEAKEKFQQIKEAYEILTNKGSSANGNSQRTPCPPCPVCKQPSNCSTCGRQAAKCRKSTGDHFCQDCYDY